MRHELKHRKRRAGFVGILSVVAAVSAARVADAQYTYVPTSNQTGNWNASARWTGGPAGTFPNAAGASATVSVPSSTAPTGNYNLQLSASAGQLITIGSLTVNNSSAATGNLRIGGNGNGSFIFDGGGGAASYTENAPVTDSTFNTILLAPVNFASNTTITQNRNLSNNAGTQFNAISAPAGVTLTKDGQGNAEFNVAPAGAGTGFQGSVVINGGAVRITDNALANAVGVDVNAGGQFQLGSGAVPNWSLAPAAQLTLRGAGKTAGTAAEGALRFQNNAGTASFNNPISLATNATVFVNANTAPTPPNPVTYGNLTLSQVVSGPGALTKSGGGVLTLTQANTYGDASSQTVVAAGTLVANNTTGSATSLGGVQVNAGAALGGTGNIAGIVTSVGGTLTPGNSAGTLTVGGLVLDAASLVKYELDTPGVVGGGVNDLTIVNGNLTLEGTLAVSPLAGFGAGVYRLFDYSGSLSGSGLAITGIPLGFDAAFDVSTPGQVNLNVSAVPEASAFLLGAVAIGLAVGWRRRLA